MQMTGECEDCASLVLYENISALRMLILQFDITFVYIELNDYTNVCLIVPSLIYDDTFVDFLDSIV